jgi:GNAT superfamily N-acetyltransferase
LGFATNDYAVLPMQAEHRAQFDSFLAAMSAEDLRLRFGSTLRPDNPMVTKYLFGPSDTTRQICGAFRGSGELIGSGCLVLSAPSVGEVSVIVRPDWRNHAVARTILSDMIEAARSDRLSLLQGVVASRNVAAVHLLGDLGFRALPPSAGQSYFEMAL